MRVNADFSRRAIVATHQYKWVGSPQGGIDRVMLDRVGTEKARATSIVRYAPNSHFPHHVHFGGEEILVLSGTFSEGNVHYPAGWYLRNPPGSSHQPSSDSGALIFVKLQQMPETERRRVRIDTRDPATWHSHNGREICTLFSDKREQVCLQRVVPNEALFNEPMNGAELLVLAGEVRAYGQFYGIGSWMRLPAGESPEIVAGSHGTTFYLKTGHLDGSDMKASL